MSRAVQDVEYLNHPDFPTEDDMHLKILVHESDIVLASSLNTSAHGGSRTD